MRLPSSNARTRLRRASMLSLALVVSPINAQPLPDLGPLPADRHRGALVLDPIATQAVRPSLRSAGDGERGLSIDPGTLPRVLDELYAGSVAEAVALRNSMPRDDADWRLATWAIALSGAEGVPLTLIDEFLARMREWPGQAAAMNAREAILLRDGAVSVLAASGEPRTLEGKLAVAELLARSDPGRAAPILRGVWRADTLDAATEAAILEWGRPLLRSSDHRARMGMLLYRERIRAAERVVPLAGEGASALAAAVGAVARRSGEGAALDAVPASLRADPLYLYARARWLRNGERQHEAARLLIANPMVADAVIDGDAWWEERRLLARQLLDQGDAKLAYGVAAGHAGGGAVDRIDASFTAGWIALRHLNDPSTARNHFAAILDLGSRALSVSRGGYWLGRAEEALGNRAAATAAYERAAGHPVSFYGQLAMERLGRSSLDASYPAPTDADRRAFAADEFVRAIERLEATPHAWRARTLYRHLARKVPTAGQAALLTAMAERKGEHRLSLQMGKTVLARGLPAVALAFPTGAIPDATPMSDTGRALAYAIARQESGFDREAVSGAGARGLLQLMPATAREVAGWMGMPYTQSRLTTDPGYNATLGARFLARLLERFDGSYVLTAAAYNAGPTRAIRWRVSYGDPAEMPVDEVVDWIERIPFAETRNYVQRVMENYQVYRVRLQGRALALGNDLTVGRR